MPVSQNLGFCFFVVLFILCYKPRMAEQGDINSPPEAGNEDKDKETIENKEISQQGTK